jgi:hypothetical protein
MGHSRAPLYTHNNFILVDCWYQEKIITVQRNFLRQAVIVNWNSTIFISSSLWLLKEFDPSKIILVWSSIASGCKYATHKSTASNFKRYWHERVMLIFFINY